MNYLKGLFTAGKVPVVIFLVFILLWGCVHKKVKPVYKPLETPEEIVPVADSVVPPIVYEKAVSLKPVPLSVRKQKFVGLMLPAILVAMHNRAEVNNRVKELMNRKELRPKEKLFIDSLMKKYRAGSISDLYTRTKPFPPSIVLAQAAIESGWGTSRFFTEANNPFGMWSFDENEKRIKSGSHRNGKYIYLRKFDNLEQAIEAYLDMLSKRELFKAFRQKNLKTDDPVELAKTLTAYSERGEAYVRDVIAVIKKNDFQKYDHYKPEEGKIP